MQRIPCLCTIVLVRLDSVHGDQEQRERDRLLPLRARRPPGVRVRPPVPCSSLSPSPRALACVRVCVCACVRVYACACVRVCVCSRGVAYLHECLLELPRCRRLLHERQRALVVGLAVSSVSTRVTHRRVCMLLRTFLLRAYCGEIATGSRVRAPRSTRATL